MIEVIEIIDEYNVMSEEDKFLLNEEIKDRYIHDDIRYASSKEDACNMIKQHFFTLSLKVIEYLTNEGELWNVYPPRGVVATTVLILIRED